MKGDRKGGQMEQGIQEGDKLLTVFEAEALTGRKASTWRRDILEKRIPVVRLGRRQVRIQLSTIQKMIREGFTPAVKQ